MSCCWTSHSATYVSYVSLMEAMTNRMWSFSLEDLLCECHFALLSDLLFLSSWHIYERQLIWASSMYYLCITYVCFYYLGQGGYVFTPVLYFFWFAKLLEGCGTFWWGTRIREFRLQESSFKFLHFAVYRFMWNSQEIMQSSLWKNVRNAYLHLQGTFGVYLDHLDFVNQRVYFKEGRSLFR